MIFLMPIYFIIVCIAIYKLMKRYQGKHKWRHFFLLAFLFYLPVGWDVILGRAYFSYLCHKDGGVHIYQTVELGPEYWNEDGSPKFYTEKGAFDSTFFDGRYIFQMSDTRYTGPFRTIQYTDQIFDIKTESLLGEWVQYGTLGGWVVNTGTPFGQSEINCHSYSDTPDNQFSTGGNSTHRKFVSYIFLRKDLNQGDDK